jgi:hypothetical protein
MSTASMPSCARAAAAVLFDLPTSHALVLLGCRLHLQDGRPAHDENCLLLAAQVAPTPSLQD